jgi:hypothetical protein
MNLVPWVSFVVKKATKLRLPREPELLYKIKNNIGPVTGFKEVAGEHDLLYSSVMNSYY